MVPRAARLPRPCSFPIDQVERALLQMRSARPETTPGTLNVTLEAQRLVMAERNGDEPLWPTMDRFLGELLALRRAVVHGDSGSLTLVGQVFSFQAVQAQRLAPSPHSPGALQGHKLVGLRGGAAAAGRPDILGR